MYFMFADDSGNTRPHRAGSRSGRVHILSGLIVHELDLYGAREAIIDAKRELFAESDPERWEMHAYNVWNSKGDFSGADQALNLEKKKEVFSRTVEAIAESGATLASVVVWKDRLPAGMGSLRIRALSWRLLVERFEAYLGARGGGEMGMVISDASNRTTEAEIREAFREPTTRMGLHKRPRSRVLKYVVFDDSRDEPLIQGADVAAYILQKECGGDSSFAGWFDALKKSMWRQGGSVHGFGIKNYPDPR